MHDAADPSQRPHRSVRTTLGVIAIGATTIIAFLPPLGVPGALAVLDAFVWSAAWALWRTEVSRRWLRYLLRAVASVGAVTLLAVTVVALVDKDTSQPGRVPPFATARASVTTGVAPLRVVFDAGDSRAAHSRDTLVFDWDIDGNGMFGDATTVRPVHIYREPGTYLVRVKVTDSQDQSSVSQPLDVVVHAPPRAPVKAPRARVESIQFREIPDSAHAFELTVAVSATTYDVEKTRTS